ncbi:GIY-YIG nuclease family protein [Acidisoma sp. 7E03]
MIGPEKGLQKVGMATDPRVRLATLQTASPQDLMIHAAIGVPFGAAPEVESQAHRLLGRMQVRNEWFAITPAEAVFAVYTAALPWMEPRQERPMSATTTVSKEKTTWSPSVPSNQLRLL